MQQFANKVAVITGAAGNLGHAVARAFATAGASIVLVDLNAEALSALQSELSTQTKRLVVPTDLIRPASVADMAQTVVAQFGRVDILVNLAGGFIMGPPLHETADRDWDFMMDLNARSVFNCCRAVIPHLSQPGGAIINVSARAARQGQPRMGPYCASKAAVLTLTESLAAEHRADGIRVNCVLPGTLDTPQNRAAMPTADYATWVPLEALADVILFLASNAARCVSGAALPVYGRS